MSLDQNWSVEVLAKYGAGLAHCEAWMRCARKGWRVTFRTKADVYYILTLRKKDDMRLVGCYSELNSPKLDLLPKLLPKQFKRHSECHGAISPKCGMRKPYWDHTWDRLIWSTTKCSSSAGEMTKMIRCDQMWLAWCKAEKKKTLIQNLFHLFHLSQHLSHFSQNWKGQPEHSQFPHCWNLRPSHRKIPNKQLEALYLDLRIFWDQSFRRCLECCDSLIFCLGFMQKAGELMGWNPHFRFHISVATFCHLCLVQSQVFLPKKAYDWLLVPFSGPLIVCAQDWIRLTFNGVCTMPILPPGCIDEATPQWITGFPKAFSSPSYFNHVNPAMIFWVCSLCQKMRHKGSVLQKKKLGKLHLHLGNPRGFRGRRDSETSRSISSRAEFWRPQRSQSCALVATVQTSVRVPVPLSEASEAEAEAQIPRWWRLQWPFCMLWWSLADFQLPKPNTWWDFDWWRCGAGLRVTFRIAFEIGVFSTYRISKFCC